MEKSFAMEMKKPEEALSFRVLLNPIICMWRFFGIDFCSPKNPSIARRLAINLLFFFQLCQGSYMFWYAWASSESNPDQIQKMALSAGRLSLGFSDFFLKIIIKLSQKKITNLIYICDDIFQRLGEPGQVLLRKFRKLSLGFILFPIMTLLFHFAEVLEHNVAPERRVDVGEESFKQLIKENPYLYYLMYYMAGPLCFGYQSINNVLVLIFMWALLYVFESICEQHPDCAASRKVSRMWLKDVINMISIHRRACHFLKCTNLSLRNYFLEWLLAQMIMALVIARVCVVAGGQSSYSLTPTLIILLITNVLYIVLFSAANNKLQVSLKHIMKTGVQLKCNGRHQISICAKIDLYVSWVNFKNPSLSIGPFKIFSPAIAIAFLDFVFSYNLYLLDKQQKHQLKT